MVVIGVDHVLSGSWLGAWPCFFFPTSASSSLERSGRSSRFQPCITQRNCVKRLDTWNVREINGTAKMEELVNAFRKVKFELLALTEAKLKGNEEVS